MGHGFVIHFVHPPSGQTLSYVAPADAPLDLGTIARRFSLDPVSVRLNAHFIGRNADFISSLTWRQVIDFFASRGLNSGEDSKNPVRVDGRCFSRTFREDAEVATPEVVASEHTHPQKLKRRAGEARVSLPFTSEKRLRRASATDMAMAMLFSPNLKRRPHDHTLGSITGSKRIRCEGIAGDGKSFQEQEKNYWSSPKRNEAGDDVSTYTALWKRVKEIRV